MVRSSVPDIIRPGCTTFHIRTPIRGPGTSTFRRSSTRRTLETKICFSLVLRVDQFPLLNRGFWILSSRKTCTLTTRIYTALWLNSPVVVLSDHYNRLLFVSTSLVTILCTRLACWFASWRLGSEHLYFHVVVIEYKRCLSRIWNIEGGRLFLNQTIQHFFLGSRSVLHIVVRRWRCYQR